MEPEVWTATFNCTYCNGTQMVTIRREDGYHVYMRCPACTLYRREIPR